MDQKDFFTLFAILNGGKKAGAPPNFGLSTKEYAKNIAYSFTPTPDQEDWGFAYGVAVPSKWKAEKKLFTLPKNLSEAIRVSAIDSRIDIPVSKKKLMSFIDRNPYFCISYRIDFSMFFLFYSFEKDKKTGLIDVSTVLCRRDDGTMTSDGFAITYHRGTLDFDAKNDGFGEDLFSVSSIINDQSLTTRGFPIEEILSVKQMLPEPKFILAFCIDHEDDFSAVSYTKKNKPKTSEGKPFNIHEFTYSGSLDPQGPFFSPAAGILLNHEWVKNEDGEFSFQPTKKPFQSGGEVDKTTTHLFGRLLNRASSFVDCCMNGESDKSPLSSTLKEISLQPKELSEFILNVTFKDVSRVVTAIKDSGLFCNSPYIFLTERLNGVKTDFRSQNLFLNLIAPDCDKVQDTLYRDEELYLGALLFYEFMTRIDPDTGEVLPEKAFSNFTEYYGSEYIDLFNFYVYSIHCSILNCTATEYDTQKPERIEDSPEISTLREENQKLKERLREAEESAAVAAKRADKELRSIEHLYEDKLSALKDKLSENEEYLSLLSSFISSDDEVGEIEESLFVDPDDAEDFETLPEEGVAFIGGHTNMIKKLCEIHPGWTYINKDNFKFSCKRSGIKVIVYWSNHLSHTIFWRSRSELEQNIPVVYATATNISRLEQELRANYAAALKRLSAN